MFFYIVLTPISTTSGLWSTGNTRKHHQIDVYIYQCGGCTENVRVPFQTSTVNNINNKKKLVCLLLPYYCGIIGNQSTFSVKLRKKINQRICFLYRLNSITVIPVSVKVLIGQNKLTFFGENCEYFLTISLNMCIRCSKQPSQWDGSLSTHNICFGWEIGKVIIRYALLSGGTGSGFP